MSSARTATSQFNGAMESYMGCVGSIRRKTHDALPRSTANSEHTIGAMDAMQQKVQKMRAPTHEYCAHTRHTVNSVGQWMKVQGKFKMQAHICRSVVMDVAAFKVSHSVDTDATAL